MKRKKLNHMYILNLKFLLKKIHTIIKGNSLTIILTFKKRNKLNMIELLFLHFIIKILQN